VNTINQAPARRLHLPFSLRAARGTAPLVALPTARAPDKPRQSHVMWSLDDGLARNSPSGAPCATPETYLFPSAPPPQ
jgi:hypothetical protein